MCRKETEIFKLEPGAEIERKLSSMFSKFQACYGFLCLRRWFKLDGIFNVDIKQAFKLIGSTLETIHRIHGLIMKSRILYLKSKTCDY